MAVQEPSWWYAEGAPWQARLLAPAAALYGAVAAHRLGRAPTHTSPWPVICIGNLTAGGTGKTPLTRALAAHLLACGARPVILSRGYGGSEHGPHWVDARVDPAARVGDEPLLLAATAPTLIARDRVAGARAIEASGQCTHILLDDGLQSPSLAKTRRIIVVDARRGVGNGRVIPAGPLRAALAAQASLIDAIVFNHGFIEGPSAEPPIAKALADLTDAPQCHGRLLVDGDVGWLRGARVVAFAGIGVPAHFFRMLRQLGADLVEARAFGDHQPYDAAMAGGLLMSARHHGALLVTTEKDVVRIGRSTVEGAELADLARIVRVTFQLEDPSDWNRLLAE